MSPPPVRHHVHAFFSIAQAGTCKIPKPCTCFAYCHALRERAACLPRQLHVLPSECQRGSFPLVKQREGSLLLTSASARVRITHAQPWAAAGEQVGPSPGAGHCSLHALLIFRTVIQLFVINLIC